MEYGWTGKIDAQVYERFMVMGSATDRLISERLTAGELAHVNLSVGYMPIIMRDPRLHPVATKVSHKHRSLACAPQLNYETFASESAQLAAQEFIRGITRCLPLLSKLGFTNSEIAEIDAFFARVSDDLQLEV